MGQPIVRDQAGRRQGARTRPDAAPRAPFVVAGVIAALVAGAVRIWQAVDRPALGWADTTDFVATSREAWASTGLWAGSRPPLVPVVLKLVGEDASAFVHWQAAVAVLCWVALAVSVATVVPGRGRWFAAAAVVAVSLTSAVTMWERSVLSESLALSLLALLLAAALQLAQGITGWRVAALLAVAALWSATRDSHASVLLVAGSAALVKAAVLRMRSRRGVARGDDGDVAPRGGGDDGRDRPDDRGPRSEPGHRDGDRQIGEGHRSVRPGAVRWWTVLGAGAVVLAFVAAWGSSHGERHAFPMRNVYEVRVLPYPDRVAWFADHGMPRSEVFLGPDARAPYREPGLPPVVYVADDDAELGEWLEWVESDGRVAYARFVATHPTYLLTEPVRVPERAFNNARGDRSFYAPPGMAVVPGVDRVLARPTTEVLLAAVLALAWAIGRRSWSPALAVGATAAALSVPHGLLAWHSDGMETARHLVVPSLQLHLGVLLLIIGAATAPLRSSPSPGAAAGSGGPAEATERRGNGREGHGYGPRMADETPLTIRRPDTPPVGGVVVVQEAFGITDHIADVCQRLADVGWLAVAPHLFHRTGDPVLPYDDFSQVAPHFQSLTPDGILADVDAALAFIADAGFPSDTAGIVGFCMGGTVALHVAVERQVGAAVSFYGGGVAKGRFGFAPLVDAAPRLRAPWLGLYGDRDRGIPVEDVERMRAAASQAEVPTEIVRYADAGHGFNRDGSPDYVDGAASDAWARTLDWFATNLTTGATELSG